MPRINGRGFFIVMDYQPKRKKLSCIPFPSPRSTEPVHRCGQPPRWIPRTRSGLPFPAAGLDPQHEGLVNPSYPPFASAACTSATAFFTLTNGRTISPITKKKISERIAGRRLPNNWFIIPNRNGPIQDVPRSLTS
jgi:hypothetical protein